MLTQATPTGSRALALQLLQTTQGFDLVIQGFRKLALDNGVDPDAIFGDVNVLKQRFTERMADEYCQLFTEDQLGAALKWHASESGKAFLVAQGSLFEAGQRVMTGLLAEVQATQGQ